MQNRETEGAAGAAGTTSMAQAGAAGMAAGGAAAAVMGVAIGWVIGYLIGVILGEATSSSRGRSPYHPSTSLWVRS